MIRVLVGFVAAILAAALTGCQSAAKTPAEHAAGAPAAPLELRVMSFNIRYGTAKDGADAWEKRRGLVLDVISKHDPDVIGMQEALRFQIDEIRAALPQYGELGAGRDDGKTKGEYAAILFRIERLQAIESGNFWFSDTPEVPGSKSWGNNITRICSWARLSERSGGRNFYVFNVHLDHESEQSRRKSAELLALRIAARPHRDEPVIVTGDFNCGEQSAAVRFLTGKAAIAMQDGKPVAGWSGMLDTFRAAHPDASDVGTFHAFKGGTSGEKIDSILVPPGTEVIEATIDRTSHDGRYPSDHYPVTARMRFR